MKLLLLALAVAAVSQHVHVHGEGVAQKDGMHRELIRCRSKRRIVEPLVIFGQKKRWIHSQP